ncbi:MAG: leucyl aminopeptidase [Phycisphaeraceae bacterium]|nr:leucyl aminopeptidase [Phycisphaeraceae bacterium]
MYRRIAHAPSRPGNAFAIALFEKPAALPTGYVALDRKSGGVISAAIKRAEFSAARGNLTTLYGADDPNQRIFVLGLGEREKFNPEVLRIGVAKLVRAAFAAKIERLELQILVGLEGKLDPDPAGRAIGDALAIANFDFDAFRGTAGKSNDVKAPPAKPLELMVSTERTAADGLERGLRIGESVNLARTLAATPPNVAHPQYIVNFAKEMAREVGLQCTIIDAEKAKSLKMGGLLAVGAAGSRPPAMIVLEWKGQGSKSKAQSDKNRGRETAHGNKPAAMGPLLLVGKAITFDTGGVSIKPAENMDKMKYDKCGGMAVLGAMHAIARLKIPQPVVGIVPVAENMLGENAYRPGDILTHHNGVTSEILNTDAEGRLILADALAYGTKTYQPRAVIDLATLTGACVVALGTVCAGAFCGNQAFRSHLFDAAEYTGERLWHMPLWDEHRQQIKGTHGDILNAGGREAGACTAAAFLSFFIEPDGPRKLPDLPWCHLDIAGVADVKADSSLFLKGPTGFGVRLLVRAIETLDMLQPRRGTLPTVGA